MPALNTTIQRSAHSFQTANTNYQHFMKDSPKIAAASWTELGEKELDSFSTTAAGIVIDQDAYPLVKPEALELELRATNYHKSLSRFLQFGGSDNKDLKDRDKVLLFGAHVQVAARLEATADGDTSYLTRPGYRLDLQGKAKTAIIAPPTLQSAKSLERGQVKIILKAKQPREIKGVVGKYSLDNGVTWVNGIYNFGLKLLLEGQPSGLAVLYQFKFMGTYERESKWSEIFRVEVF